MPCPLTFPEMVKTPGKTSLAYWIGVFQPEILRSDILAGSVADSMATQYDVEEQAGRTGKVFPEEADWRRFFQPTAPVQLTAAWSPLPDAIALLGAATLEAFEQDGFEDPPDGDFSVVLGWDARAVLAAAGKAPVIHEDRDRARFAELLAATATRARERRSGLVICAKPGWSCEQATAFDARTVKRMVKAGFAVTDRRASAG